MYKRQTTNYDSSLNISEFEDTKLDLKLYPNPTQDFIAIQSSLFNKTIYLELINELGQLILENKILAGTTLTVMETHTLYNGVYFLNVFYMNHKKSYKIIINK